MEDKLTTVAAAAAKDKGIAEKLDEILAGPNDRAYVLCTMGDCELNTKGHCTIFTLLDVPRMKRGAPCDKYRKGA